MILPRRVLDLTGRSFGRLEVMSFAGTRRGNAFWICHCRCGREETVSAPHLKSGCTRSCGCLAAESRPANFRHGMSNSYLHSVWRDMRNRCSNPRHQAYSCYGGRGILVCSRWDSFEAFVEDVGDRPSDRHQLDRIDNDGHYNPGNVRWVVCQANNRNKRNNVKVSWRGKTLCLSEWAERLGIKYGTLYSRYTRGWSTSRMLGTVA